jgi:hypothetical protein
MGQWRTNVIARRNGRTDECMGDGLWLRRISAEMAI